MAFLPEVIVEVPEAEAAASGLLAWIGRSGVLSGATSLLSLLFGHRSQEPATGNAMRPVVNLLAYPQRAIYLLLYYVNHALDLITRALTRAETYVNNKVRSEAVRASGQAYAVLHWAQAAVRGEAVRASGQIFSVLHWAQGAIAKERVRAAGQALSVLKWAQDAVAAERVRASGQANSVLDYARGRVDAEAATRFQQDQLGRVYADTVSTREAARATAQLSTQEALAVHPSYRAINDDLAQAKHEAGTGLPDLAAVMALVPALAPTTAPQAMGDMATVTRVLTRALADCVVPNCRNLSKYGRDLQGLFGLVEGAALLAFIAEIIRDPEGAARITVDVLDGPLHATVGAFETLIGA